MRMAQCSCGSLKVEAQAEPQRVAACHCLDCQRRTGSPFGVSVFFNTSDVVLSGPSTIYVRTGGSGKKLEVHFCPTCGSTVYWFPEFLPGVIGVALGAFADPDFPAPTLSVFERSRHPWVGLEGEMTHLAGGRAK